MGFCGLGQKLVQGDVDFEGRIVVPLTADNV